MTTNAELTERGVKLFAKAEQGIFDAVNALQELSDVMDQGYQIDAVNGTVAIKFRAENLQTCGLLGEALERTLKAHVTATGVAKATGADIATPYAILPPREGISQRSGGGGR